MNWSRKSALPPAEGTESLPTYGAYTRRYWKMRASITTSCSLAKVSGCESVVMRRHKQELDKQEADFAEQLGKKKNMEQQLAVSIDEKRKYISELEQERDAYMQNKTRLEDEISQSSKSHEEEIQLRIKFESKFNRVYSVYRELQGRVKWV